MGEKNKSGKTGALRSKSLFIGKSPLLQCVQLAYIVLIEPKHIYEVMTLSPKDYCLIPGIMVIKLVSLRSWMQGYNPITKGLLTNPWQRRHKTC